MKIFPGEDLHDSIAIIVSNDDALKCVLKALEALKSKLGEIGFRTVTAKEASERFSNKKPSDGKGYIIVDTISNMNVHYGVNASKVGMVWNDCLLFLWIWINPWKKEIINGL
jgi:hypothetical protein